MALLGALLASGCEAVQFLSGESAANSDCRSCPPGFCSWCLRWAHPVLLEKTPLLSWYRCNWEDCRRGLRRCTLPCCGNYACWGTGGKGAGHRHDPLCAQCSGILESFRWLDDQGDRRLSQVMDYSQILRRSTVVLAPEVLGRKLSVGASLRQLVSSLNGLGCPQDCTTALGAPLGTRSSLLVAHLCYSYLTHPFRLVPKNSFPGPLTVITINGYCTEGCVETQDWGRVLRASRRFSETRWLHLDWESGLKATSVLFATVGLGVIPTMALHFEGAKKRAKMVGFLLAEILTRCSAAGEGGERFVLMGHSLGGRVIHEALTHLLRSPSERWNVEEVHLLGACTRSFSWAWPDIALKSKVVNHFSKDDGVLLAPELGGSKVAGRNPILCPEVVNVDHSSGQKANVVIARHTHWKVAGVLE